MKRMASAGAVLAVPPLLAACRDDGGSNDAAPQPAPIGRDATTRTLFFNLAHEPYRDKSYFLEAGGRSYRLVKVSERPDVLAAERTTNAFLAAVPDDQITHHVEAVHIPGDSTMLAYVGVDIDRSAGTWSMSGVYFQVHPAVFVDAVARVTAVHGTAASLFAASSKRQRYGLPPATSAKDLHDEAALNDPPTHASTLIGLHPDLMSLEPTSCVVVQNNHVLHAFPTVVLTRQMMQLGTAMPQPPGTTPGKTNASGWATLQPIVDPKTGVPARVKLGPDAGRLQYTTLLHPDVAKTAGTGMRSIAGLVKNDPALGGDVTRGVPQDTGVGRLWARRDGRPFVDQSVATAAASASNVTMTLTSRTSQAGLDFDVAQATASNGRPQVTVTVDNWFLRYLGVFVQFLDGANPPNVIPLASLPEYGAGGILQSPPNHINGTGGADTADTMFVTMVNPITTIMGIPIENSIGVGQASMQITLPAKASGIRILCGGLGCGSNNYPQTLAAAAGMTATFCYGFTAVFAAAGAAPLLSELGQVISAVLNAVATELASIISDVISGNDWTTAAFWIDQATTFVQFLLGYAGGAFIGKIVASILGDLAVGAAEKAIPVANLVMAAISAAIGIADIVLTTTDIALSPWTYVNDLVFTYDLSVTLAPTNGLPQAADHYKVTAMFDDGTPQVKSLPLPVPLPSSLPPVVFYGVPLGGNVNVSAAFVQTAKTAAADDVLLGKGTTGPQPNSGAAQTVPIVQLKFPIGSTTQYRHKQKTLLADNGAHVWQAAPAPTATAASVPPCGLAGTICGWRDITVRQDVNGANGFVGYAWQSQNADPTKVPLCGGTASGQFDQIANLSSGANAESGAGGLGCGINAAGVRVAYSLLSHPTANYYVDTTDPSNLHIRQVRLGGTAPQFDGPTSGRSFGVLNFASDALLLHPSGRLLSISQTYNKFEVHRLPPAAVDDRTAAVRHRAQPMGGLGTRPGLFTTPTAAAFGADGTLLVLEQTNNRIQAFDIGINPVRHFTNQPSPYFLTLDATPQGDGWQHLDMAVEFTGFIYVLSFNANSNTYQMNIYHPGQSGTTPVAVASTMNAARLTVDFWRSVYTLNYETIQRANPNNGTPAPVTEPSISLWEPCNVGTTC